VVVDSFSSASVVRGSEGKKEGGPMGVTTWQREKEKSPPGAMIDSAGQPATTLGRRAWAAALSRNRAERWDADRRAQPAQCRVAWFEWIQR
jgi:hypothetical protein